MNPSINQRISAFFSLKVIVAAVILVPTAISCISYVEVSHVIKGQQSLIYQINSTGEITQTTVFNPSNLIRDLNKGKATYSVIIKSFQLESMDVEVEPNAANTAQIFQLLSLKARQQNLTTNRELLNRQDKLIPVGRAAAFLANAYLLGDGVDEINKLIGGSLVGRRPSDILSFIIFELKGQPVPANSRVSIKLTVNLNVTIEYTQCEQMVDFFLEGSSTEC